MDQIVCMYGVTPVDWKPMEGAKSSDESASTADSIYARAAVYAAKGKTNLSKHHRRQSYIKIATEQKEIDDARHEAELRAYANDIAEDVRKSAIERLDKIAVPSTPDEIRSRYWRRFMHKARKCAKQAWAMRDSFAGNDEDFVDYFMELMEE